MIGVMFMSQPTERADHLGTIVIERDTEQCARVSQAQVPQSVRDTVLGPGVPIS